jgi:PAS domain S-box-containing protein
VEKTAELPAALAALVPAHLPVFLGMADAALHQLTWINETGLQLFELNLEQVQRGYLVEQLFAHPPVELKAYCQSLGPGSGVAFTGQFLFSTLKKRFFDAAFYCKPFEFHGQQFQLLTVMPMGEATPARGDHSGSQESNRFRVLFENATIGMMVADSRGAIVTLNPYAEQQFGYSKGELIGKNIEVIVPESLRRKHSALRSDFMKSPQHRPMGIGRDLRGQRKDGSTFPVEISLSYYQLNGQPFVIAFINDITIRKQAEDIMIAQKEAAERYSEEVKKLNEALERRVEERTMVLRETLDQLEKSKSELEESLEKERELSDLKSRFVSMASHEFRTPLSTILSSASLIEKYPKEEEQDKRRRHVHRISESVKNLNDILEDFLSLGKLEEGLVQARPEKLLLPDFIQAILLDLDVVKKKQQNINYAHAGMEEAFTDRHLLRNILLNLLSNALKFSADDGEVELKSSGTPGELVITVKDYGIGISDEDQLHLFGRFFRGKNALNIKGTGLGLHIVSKYLELLQGHIDVASRLNEGTTITIRLPNIPTKQ